MPRLALRRRAAACASAPATAVAQQPAPTTPTDHRRPTAPRPGRRSSTRSAAAVVSAQQGHARFLVGVRLATPAKLTVQVLSSAGKIVQDGHRRRPRKAGRAYVRVEAV